MYRPLCSRHHHYIYIFHARITSISYDALFREFFAVIKSIAFDCRRIMESETMWFQNKQIHTNTSVVLATACDINNSRMNGTIGGTLCTIDERMKTSHWQLKTRSSDVKEKPHILVLFIFIISLKVAWGHATSIYIVHTQFTLQRLVQ